MTETGCDLDRDPHGSPDATEVAFVDATDAVDDLLADPELAEESRVVRERMREADRVHAMTLAMVRHAAGLTQVELAKALNVSQGAVARTEGRGDVLLSTLRAYLEARVRGRCCWWNWPTGRWRRSRWTRPLQRSAPLLPLR